MNFRPTVDSDFLCFGKADDNYLKQGFSEICLSSESHEDGMCFDKKSIVITQIRDNTEYGGTRIVLAAYLGQARISLQFDIGIGDSITPDPEIAKYPVILNGAIPQLKIYPKVTAIAEKADKKNRCKCEHRHSESYEQHKNSKF